MNFAITQPTYKTRNLHDYESWLIDNGAAVIIYAQQLGVTNPELETFAHIQYDRAVLLDRMEFELALSHQLQQVAA